MKNAPILRRRALRLLGACFTFSLVCFALPHVVAAQVVFDPTTAANGVIGGFLTTSQAWGYKLYVALMVFDIFALAVAALLFRDNLGELISGVTLKIVVGSVFIYFVVSANTFFPNIVNGFAQAGQQAGGTSNSTPSQLLLLGAGISTAYFSAADSAHDTDVALASGPIGICDPPFDPCLIGAAQTAADGHKYFILLCNALGMITALAFIGMFLTYVLVTIESYIVIFAGVFYLGFAGSKFTAPFAQGYLNYMISVGTKLFTMYLVMGIILNLMPGLIGGAVLAIVGASVVPWGLGTIAIIGIAAFAALQTLTAAAIIYAIPQYAAAFLSGQSGASGNAFLGQIASSVSGMQMMMNGFKGAQQGGSARNDNAITERHLDHGASSVAGQLGQFTSMMGGPSNVFGGQTNGSSANTSSAGDTRSENTTVANNVASPSSSGSSAVSGSGAGGLGGLGTGGSWKSTFESRPPTPAPNAAPTSQGGGSISGVGNVEAGSSVGRDMAGSSSGDIPATPVYNPFTRSLQQPAGQGAALSGGGGGGGNRLPDNAEYIRQFGSSSNPNVTAQQHEQFRDMLRNTPMNELSDNSWDAINADPELHEIAKEIADERGVALDLARDGQMGLGLQGIAIAVPRDSAPPTAAQIRLSNPDRL